MPGVPFSKACEACKRRRVKCDELTPCTPCLRLGKGPCPGYRHQAKFIDEGARMRKKQPSTAIKQETTGHQELRAVVLSRPANQLKSLATGLVGDSHVASGDASPLYAPRAFSAVIGDGPTRLGFEIMMLSHLPVIHCGRMRSCLALLPGSSLLKRTLQKAEVMPSYVCYIPQRLGWSPVLDSAVDLVFTAAGHLALPPRDTLQFVLLKKYDVALRHVQAAILDPKRSKEVDVLASVLLLSAYECINSTSIVAWLNHQRGIYRLIESRGPSGYQKDFDRQLLIASIGTIITIALRDDHPCFMDHPEWQDVLASKPSDSMIKDEWVDSYRSLPLMCLVPRLLSSCRDIVRNRDSQTRENIESLVAAASLLRQAFLDMGAKFDWKPGRYMPILAPRTEDDFPRVFCDAEDQRTANYGNHLSSLVIVNRILLALRPSAIALEAESRTSALEIQYLHSYLKSQPDLRKIWLVHSERVALAILLTSNYWTSTRGAENGNAHDPRADGGGNLIEPWKFDVFDDTLCARKTDAALMFHYPPVDDVTLGTMVIPGASC
ncbi:hypothetical protein GQ53DRAFT_816488 [Thozetella sp. PMI_491]|nr:hypothetical protein GQ53DRAFT_816488 [Thozetella sp. PMI_491]